MGVYCPRWVYCAVLCDSLFDHLSSLIGEAVFLKSAVGLFWDGSFNEAKIQELIYPQIEFTGDASVPQFCRQLGF